MKCNFSDPEIALAKNSNSSFQFQIIVRFSEKPLGNCFRTFSQLFRTCKKKFKKFSIFVKIFLEV